MGAVEKYYARKLQVNVMKIIRDKVSVHVRVYNELYLKVPDQSMATSVESLDEI